MVTLQKYGGSMNRVVCEIVGLSTDEKPADKVEGITITNGSTFYEMDSKKLFMYSYETKTWLEQ